MGRQMLGAGDQSRNANLHVLLACAYGQQYAYERETNPDNPLLPSIRQRAIDAVKAALKANPDVKAWLRSLWQPAQDAIDNDLAVFGPTDADLSGLLA
jgi:hypothetical protein